MLRHRLPALGMDAALLVLRPPAPCLVGGCLLRPRAPPLFQRRPLLPIPLIVLALHVRCVATAGIVVPVLGIVVCHGYLTVCCSV